MILYYISYILYIIVESHSKTVKDLPGRFQWKLLVLKFRKWCSSDAKGLEVWIKNSRSKVSKCQQILLLKFWNVSKYYRPGPIKILVLKFGKWWYSIEYGHLQILPPFSGKSVLAPPANLVWFGLVWWFEGFNKKI